MGRLPGFCLTVVVRDANFPADASPMANPGGHGMIRNSQK